MLDRLTRVRMLLLTYLQRGLILVLILLADAFVMDTFFRHVPEDKRWHIIPPALVHFVADSMPHLHPLHWVFMIVAAIYLLRLVRALRNAIARLG
jgi:hypothetical protein